MVFPLFVDPLTSDVEVELHGVFAGISPDYTPVDDPEALNARNDFGAFMRRMYPGYVDGAHLHVLRDALTRVARGTCKRLIVIMPPRHSKSLHVSENYPAWYLGNNPDHKVMLASHTADLAESFSRRVRNKMIDPLWPFPEVQVAPDNGQVKRWSIKGHPKSEFKAFGVGGSPPGAGGDLIIIDDPVRNQQDAESPQVRQTTWEWYEGTLYTRRQPGAAIIVTATRWHEDDLVGRLLAQMDEGGEQWEVVHMPAIATEDDDAIGRNIGDILWPEFWTEAEYTKARMASDRVWWAQYQGTPTNKQGNLLVRTWFPDSPETDIYTSFVQSWDCASVPGISNDWSVCATIGVTSHSYDILDIFRAQLAYPDLEQAARDQATWVQSLYPGVPLTISVEWAMSGIALAQSLEATSRYAVHRFPATKADGKVQRVIDLTPLAKSGRVRVFPAAPWRKEMFSEFTGFPHATHDDIVDAVMMGVSYASGVGTEASASSRDYLREREPEHTAMRRGGRRKPPPPNYTVPR